MNEQAPAGWYPDGQGSERFWDGASWTDQIRATGTVEEAKRPGAFSKLGAAVRSAATERKTAKEEAARKQAEDARAAGRLTTSGVFGTSTVEIYENGFVRVASLSEGARSTSPKAIDKDTPYERLRSIKFNQPNKSQTNNDAGSSEGSLGTAMTGLLKGGKAIMKVSPAGLAATAATSYLASSMSGKRTLTIVTDRQIHTLTNQASNSVGLKTSKQGHDEVGLALEAAGNSVLSSGEAPPAPRASLPPTPPQQTAPSSPSPSASPSLSDRLRELAELHKDGILSDEEFATAKSKLLGGI